MGKVVTMSIAEHLESADLDQVGSELVRLQLTYRADIDPIEGLDVRLNVQSDGWLVLFGDPGFDADHRGLWGSSVIHADDTREELYRVAQDLIDQINAEYEAGDY